MSDTILTPEAVARLRAGNTNPHVAAALVSHEALRSRLAEAEAERDEMARKGLQVVVERDAVWAMLQTAEAALAEAVELLRGTGLAVERLMVAVNWVGVARPEKAALHLAAASDQALDAAIAARAFIEAHG